MTKSDPATIAAKHTGRITKVSIEGLRTAALLLEQSSESFGSDWANDEVAQLLEIARRLRVDADKRDSARRLPSRK